ncbi:hypothetical protein [Devosia sp. 2618]|uniref:hypothetical protein n=1 Tax=Devosia sp. 2618 TaxID=3156454 RepID=UPI0033929BBC
MKSIASAIALTAAMTFSGAAFAQTTFNGVELSADELPKVQERCDQLNTAASTASVTENSSSTDTTAGGADVAVENAPAVNEIAQATSTVDLDTVTIEQCKAAGLIS